MLAGLLENGKSILFPYGHEPQDKVMDEWWDNSLKDIKCAVCGEKLLNRKQFIWWRAAQDIFLCVDHAEEVLSGLGRDLAELKGDVSAKRKTSDLYNPIKIRAERDKLRQSNFERMQKIVTLQNELGKPD